MEAYTEDEIKTVLTWARTLGSQESSNAITIQRLIFTWATAKAEAERLRHQGTNHFFTRTLDNGGVQTGFFRCEQCSHKIEADWLNAVLSRIGWPKEA